MPLFAKTKAPASNAQPLKNSSFTTEAVNPAPLIPFPDTYLPFGATLLILFRIWDFPEPGSPINNIWISPLVETPPLTFRTPLNNCKTNASFILS